MKRGRVSISSVCLLKTLPLTLTFDLTRRQKPRSQTITDEGRNGGISIARRIKGSWSSWRQWAKPGALTCCHISEWSRRLRPGQNGMWLLRRNERKGALISGSWHSSDANSPFAVNQQPAGTQMNVTLTCAPLNYFLITGWSLCGFCLK